MEGLTVATKYIIKQHDSDGTWAVINTETGNIAELDEIPQDKLTEASAKEVARLLNEMTEEGQRF